MFTCKRRTRGTRHGRMLRPAEPNIKTGSLECRLERYVAGREIGVVVAIDDVNPNLIVITAMDRQER